MNKRWTLFCALTIITAGLCVLGAYRHPWTSLEECLEDPVKYDGHQVDQFRESMIGPLYPDGFELLQKKAPSIRVFCDTTGLIRGEFIGMKATFHKEGYLDHAVFQVAYKRREKIAVSVIPAILVVGLFVYHFRWNRKLRWIEPGKHA